MADPARDSLLREIDEDLRHERYALLWKRYGTYIIALTVVLVLAVAGYEGWKSYQLGQRAEASERFTQAIVLAQSDAETAATIFADIAENGPDGYATLARLREAAIHVANGDLDAATAAYGKLESNAATPFYRDLAVVLRVMAEMETTVSAADAARLREELAPLTVAGRPLRHTARELSALLAVVAGNPGEARTILADLVSDAEAPTGVQARAEKLLAAIGAGS